MDEKTIKIWNYMALSTLGYSNIKRDQNFQIIADSSLYYNCIAYTLDIKSFFIWPTFSGIVKTKLEGEDIDAFWPNNLSLSKSLNNFKEFYKLFGFNETENSDYEDGYKKIAVYSINNQVTHAVVIHPDRICSGKLGYGPVITHTFGFDKLNGIFNNYGNVTFFTIKQLTNSRSDMLSIIKKYSG